MPAINHAVAIPSANNAPNPSGTPLDPDQPSPTQQNPWLCNYPCTMPGHTDIVQLLWVDPGTVTDDNNDSNQPGPGFSLPDSEANNPTFGSVAFTYDPPLS